jgi:hypothetical protein
LLLGQRVRIKLRQLGLLCNGIFVQNVQVEAMKNSSRWHVVFALTALALSACSRSGSVLAPTAMTSETDPTAAVLKTQSHLETEQAEILPTETLEPTATDRPEHTPTYAATPTPLPPKVRVSENTNCRSGPDSSFAFLGVLSVGQEAEVLAKSEVPDYWLITNPGGEGGEKCWLWGAFATIEGDTGDLPVINPEPTPTPNVGFDVWFHGFEPCSGSQTAIFAIRNAGAVRLWSGWVAAYAMDPLDDLYGPAKERHPFADSPLPACPPGHGNELYPGEVRYIHAPLSNVPHGRNAYTEITLCSADHGGGDCVTKIGYFYIP